VEFRLVGFGRKVHFSFEKVEIVQGVNSNIDEKTHFLMWDFDEVPLPLVLESLKNVQGMYNLPAIQVLSTGKENGYHAYCFKSCTFRFARTILASTANVDTKYVALGFMRGYFTLRYSEIKDREFNPVCELPSKVPADLDYSDVNCFVNYTKRVK